MQKWQVRERKRVVGYRPSQESHSSTNQNTKAVETQREKNDDFFIWHAVFFTILHTVQKRAEETKKQQQQLERLSFFCYSLLLFLSIEFFDGAVALHFVWTNENGIFVIIVTASSITQIQDSVPMANALPEPIIECKTEAFHGTRREREWDKRGTHSHQLHPKKKYLHAAKNENHLKFMFMRSAHSLYIRFLVGSCVFLVRFRCKINVREPE